MARYQVTLAYDGTDFAGFQRQAKARTVQQTVEEALRRLDWQGRSILCAGRTDAGVHASGQVIAFDLDWAHTPEELVRAMNAHLPGDVSVRAAALAADSFHPRFEALSRRYLYRLFCDKLRDPLRERYAWRVWPAVAPAVLEQAARSFQGRHDFAAFGAPPHAEGSTVRTVFSAGWRPEGTGLVFEVVANAFLYHMVRRMVTLQVEIGQGREPPEVVGQYLERQIPAPVLGLAPPQGLALVEVRFAEVRE
jgi:tRNA pseudouridine38-40 synthase